MYQVDSALQELGNLLRRDEEGNLWNMGATTVSKVTARKRPALVPIQDSAVMREFGATDATYWDQWWQAMHLHILDRPVVGGFASQLRGSVPEAARLSLLRTHWISLPGCTARTVQNLRKGRPCAAVGSLRPANSFPQG
ncbi:DUF6308 family protein [Paeniglutamicibacter cryotolerans]|uniref:Uncharacterized protein n=1 Tax=Paeniglutamicibacter cryotolerans TaxID=670079 RepID=A0A839QUK7_9MICC|nr:DUF6308 family protein [Paeniglutamicibacter cryotolerans]MBB2997646.1 hypothetical protein [Paeniglutamicibacter cryotolerans]